MSGPAGRTYLIGLGRFFRLTRPPSLRWRAGGLVIQKPAPGGGFLNGPAPTPREAT